MANPGADKKFSTRTAPDRRADEGRRFVSITPHCILIERALSGMKMRICVPVSSYRDVVLASDDDGGQPSYRVILAHRDPELSVELDVASSSSEISQSLRRWTSFFAKPGQVEDVASPVSPHRRRPNALLAKRRPRRLARRKPGRQDRLATVFRAEREIICYE